MCNTVIGVILDFHNNESHYLLSYQKKNNSLFPPLESVPEESILTSLDVDVSESKLDNVVNIDYRALQSK